jgi:hypothetical protein
MKPTAAPMLVDGGATDAGRPYFAMELVRGKPITEYCDREQLSTRERLTLFVAVCQGVQHAHQKWPRRVGLDGGHGGQYLAGRPSD